MTRRGEVRQISRILMEECLFLSLAIIALPSIRPPLSRPKAQSRQSSFKLASCPRLAVRLTPCFVKIITALDTNPTRRARLEHLDVIDRTSGTGIVLKTLPSGTERKLGHPQISTLSLRIRKSDRAHVTHVANRDIVDVRLFTSLHVSLLSGASWVDPSRH